MIKKENIDDAKQANPYLAARKVWNSLIAPVVHSNNMLTVFGILCLMIALAAVGGITYIGSQSKFVPYVVEVDKLGQAVAVAPAEKAGRPNLRVTQAYISSFIHDLRMVTIDVALQTKAVYRVYALLSADDPATMKTNEFYSLDDTNPFKRAATEMVSIEIDTAIPQTEDTWQIDWIETIRDRQGALKGKPIRFRALVTVYVMPPSPQTDDKQINQNPLGIHVRDYSWAKQG